MNYLYYGDNLTILRDYLGNESVDLVYLDPPFNSNRNYNVLFKDESGHEAEAQMTAFEDSWHWNVTAEKSYQELVTLGDVRVLAMIGALRQFIGPNQMMAYLVMMTIRLVELHRVLKPTGSLYLHCDPTASHYLKIILDTIFGSQNFKNEIIWRRTTVHNDAKQGAKHFGRVHDSLLFYTKNNSKAVFNAVYVPYKEEYIIATYNRVDTNGRRFKASDLSAAKPGGDTAYSWHGIWPPQGRFWAYSKENMEKFEKEGRIYYSQTGRPYLKHYLDEMEGVSVQTVWDDIAPVGAQTAERLGYPTQKPLALLERIIAASSKPGDVVLDPFCGCGTAICAAQKMGRPWIGIDITHLSIALQKYRLKDMFGLLEKGDYEVRGEPEDLPSARQLASDNRYQFQWWALSLVRARPVGGDPAGKQGKKGKDQGIDGLITFIDDLSQKPKRVIVQVKSGKVKSGDMRDLRGVIEREGAAIGVLITLEPPSKEMIVEGVAAGFYHSAGWEQDYPRLQILTIADLLNEAEIKMPPTSITFKQAQKVKPESGLTQKELF